MYGPDGALVSLHARCVVPCEPKDKAASPAGFEIRGLVMADTGGRAMLRGEFAPGAFIIAEGVPDFATWGTRYGDADEDAPAVLGVLAGSWTADVAAHVPSGIRIAIRTHPDAAGFRYADAIAKTLAHRCAVYRFPCHKREAA